jgi:hypothetical protein
MKGIKVKCPALLLSRWDEEGKRLLLVLMSFVSSGMSFDCSKDGREDGLTL